MQRNNFANFAESSEIILEGKITFNIKAKISDEFSQYKLKNWVRAKWKPVANKE